MSELEANRGLRETWKRGADGLYRGQILSDELADAHPQVESLQNPQLLTALEEVITILHSGAGTAVDFLATSGSGFNLRDSIGHAVKGMLKDGDTFLLDRFLYGNYGVANRMEPEYINLCRAVRRLQATLKLHCLENNIKLYSSAKPNDALLFARNEAQSYAPPATISPVPPGPAPNEPKR